MDWTYLVRLTYILELLLRRLVVASWVSEKISDECESYQASTHNTNFKLRLLTHAVRMVPPRQLVVVPLNLRRFRVRRYIQYVVVRRVGHFARRDGPGFFRVGLGLALRLADNVIVILFGKIKGFGEKLRDRSHSVS